MARESGYHFIFTLENIGDLKKMVDDLCQYQEESAYIEVQFYPPEKEKYRTAPAQLYFSLTRPIYDPKYGNWLISPHGCNLYFDETRVDKRYKGSGEIARALPPFFDGKELPQEILEDVLVVGGWALGDK